MSIFRKINPPKGCDLKYTSTQIVAAYAHPAQLELIANQVVGDLFLCQYFKNQVTWFVKNNGGKLEDVEDFIQESLFIVKKNLLSHAFKGADLTSYTIGIARNSWLNIIKKKKKIPLVDIGDDQKAAYVISNIKEPTPNQEEWRIIQEEENNKSKYLLTILKDCLSDKQIKLLSSKYIQKLSYVEIAAELHYKSADAAKNAAMDARKKIKNCIQQNPRYSDLLASFNV